MIIEWEGKPRNLAQESVNVHAIYSSLIAIHSFYTLFAHPIFCPLGCSIFKKKQLWHRYAVNGDRLNFLCRLASSASQNGNNWCGNNM